jgi:hypothetical protein
VSGAFTIHQKPIGTGTLRKTAAPTLQTCCNSKRGRDDRSPAADLNIPNGRFQETMVVQNSCFHETLDPDAATLPKMFKVFTQVRGFLSHSSNEGSTGFLFIESIGVEPTVKPLDN